MLFPIQLQPDTVLANIRFMWIVAGVAQSPAGPAGISQPDAAFPFFLVNSAEPVGAQEIIIYDSSASPLLSNYSTGNYRTAKALEIILANSTLLGALGDPWASALPGGYGAHTAGAIIGRFDRGEPSEPLAVVISATAAGQVTGYLYTYDKHGALKPNVDIVFELSSISGAGSSFSTEPFIATSDGDGFLSVVLPEKAVFRAQRGANGLHVPFQTPERAGAVITDGFALPAILGKP